VDKSASMPAASAGVIDDDLLFAMTRGSRGCYGRLLQVRVEGRILVKGEMREHLLGSSKGENKPSHDCVCRSRPGRNQI
jgi:hypothetical protein